MLFTPEKIFAARRKLLVDVDAGTISDLEAALQALELDPLDAYSLHKIAQAKMKEGDAKTAEDYLWRAVANGPQLFEPWFNLGWCAVTLGKGEAWQNAVAELALTKALRSPDGVRALEDSPMKNLQVPEGVSKLDAYEAMRSMFYDRAQDEPGEVKDYLRPYRLTDLIMEEARYGLDADVVDEIVAQGASIVPFLVAIIRQTAQPGFEGNELSPAITAIALLGEIADVSHLSEMLECGLSDDDELNDVTLWAVRRTEQLKPEETFQELQKIAPEAEPGLRGQIALLLGYIDNKSERDELLLRLLDPLPAMEKDERMDVFVNVAGAILMSKGTPGKEKVWSLLARYADLLPKKAKKEIRELVSAYELISTELPIALAAPPSGTVYDYCKGVDEDEDDLEDEDGDPFGEDESEEDEFVPEPIQRRPVPGRNDPCWCGSGKKYKKCHLEADEKPR